MKTRAFGLVRRGGALVVLAVAAVGCGGAAAADAGGDAAADAAGDAVADAARDAVADAARDAVADAARDAAADAAGDAVAARDAAADAAGDAVADAAADAARDAAADAAADAAGDAGVDVTADAARDAGVDAARDAAGDAVADAGVDAARDAAADAGVDAARDAGVDAAADAGVVCSGADAGAVAAEPVERVYVAPGGSDSAAGTMAAPLASLSAAAQRLTSGGTVIVRGGTYGPQRFAGQGMAGHPLFIRAADGEVPVFDGSAVSTSWSAVLKLSSASHVVLQGLEVTNCHAANCAAIDAPPVVDLAVVDCHLHDMDGPAARFAGSAIRFEGNHIHDVALVNVNNTAYPNGGWPTCMGTVPNRTTGSSPLADGVVIRNNRIENCWGEGIGLWFASNAVVDGNVVDNSFNVGIYLDNSRSVTITRNFVHVSRGIHGGQGTGILLGTEPYSGLTAYACADVSASNNVVVGGQGVGWWKSSDTTAANTYQRVSLVHNTVVSTAGGALSFAPVSTSAPVPAGCVAENNVFGETSGAYLGNPTGWTFTSNAWLGGQRPSVAGSTDVAVSATAGTVTTATDVEPLASVVGAGAAGTGVTTDYACNARSTTAPRRGAFER